MIRATTPVIIDDLHSYQYHGIKAWLSFSSGFTALNRYLSKPTTNHNSLWRIHSKICRTTPKIYLHFWLQFPTTINLWTPAPLLRAHRPWFHSCSFSPTSQSLTAFRPGRIRFREHFGNPCNKSPCQPLRHYPRSRHLAIRTFLEWSLLLFLAVLRPSSLSHLRSICHSVGLLHCQCLGCWWYPRRLYAKVPI